MLVSLWQAQEVPRISPNAAASDEIVVAHAPMLETEKPLIPLQESTAF
jgi:hypothetical protein